MPRYRLLTGRRRAMGKSEISVERSVESQASPPAHEGIRLRLRWVSLDGPPRVASSVSILRRHFPHPQVVCQAGERRVFLPEHGYAHPFVKKGLPPKLGRPAVHPQHQAEHQPHDRHGDHQPTDGEARELHGESLRLGRAGGSLRADDRRGSQGWLSSPSASSHQSRGTSALCSLARPYRGTPVVELARGDTQPGDESLGGNLGTFGPVADVIDDRVAYVVGNPGAWSEFPKLFF